MKILSRAGIKRFSFYLFSLFLLPLIVQGADFLNVVVINEAAWMGNTNSSNDEWIELYNNSEYPINLEGWTIKAADGTPEIKLSGTVPAKSFYLLERTDDNTLLDIPADLIYKGALGNNGEKLLLYNSFNRLVDEVNCSSGWFAGDNSAKQTMERINPIGSGNDSTNWQTSQNPGGTPKSPNSQPTGTPSAAPSISPVESPGVRPLQSQNYPEGVVFNEILPSPEGPDETEEWIEIYNQNIFEVDLSGWKIEDGAGKITSFVFPAGKKIAASEFLVLTRPETKIVLNNEGDILKIVRPDEKITDSVTYEKSPRAQSYNRTPLGWSWNGALTPGSANALPQDKPSGVGPNSADKTNEESLPSDSFLARETAAVGKNSNLKNLFPFFFALIMAVFSAIIILALKKIIKSRQN